MAEDQHPELRCRCTHRAQYPEISIFHQAGPDPYYDRCKTPATAEDGLCDHCRQDVHPDGCPGCGPAWPTCCRRTNQQRGVRFVDDPRTPCMAVLTDSEVPF